MKEFLLRIIEKLWLRKKSIPVAFILLTGVFFAVAKAFNEWNWVDVSMGAYIAVAICLFCVGVVYSICCLACDHLPKAPKETLGVLFCIDAESSLLYDTAKFKLVENFNEVNPGGKVRVVAKCISKKQAKRYDLQNHDSAVKLLMKTRCVLLVRVRYSADDAKNAENFEMRIGCGVRHPRFDEKADAVLVQDMSMLTETVRNQHFTNRNAINIFNFTTHTLFFACNYILGFVYLLARNGEAAYELLTTARKVIDQDDATLSEKEKWRSLVDDRIYATLAQISIDCLARFQKEKDKHALQRMEQALETANTIYPYLYFYNVNMAYIQVTLHHNAASAKILIDKCKLSARNQREKSWLFSDAFLAAYLDYAPGTIVARYNKAFAEEKESNLVMLVEHVEFMIAEQPEKNKLHLAAALVYEVLGDSKLMKQHLSIFLKNAGAIDTKARKLLEDKLAANDCREDCNHNCEKCAS